MRKCFEVLASLSLLIVIASAQAQQIPEAYQALSIIEKQLATDTVPWKYQLAATRFAMNGCQQKADSAWALFMRRIQFVSASDSMVLLQMQPIDAIAPILKRAAEAKITMVNEAHHQEGHRLFTAALLPGLYAEGYRYLGVEALAEATAINQRKYATTKDGYYTQSPEFGHLLNTALELGFELFAYEAAEDLFGADREQAQAEAIWQFMQTHPTGKVLIHAGFDHVHEGVHKQWGKAMAGRFKQISGIDPLTIDQVRYSASHSPVYYRIPQNVKQLKQPVIYQSDEKVIYNGDQQTDIVVIHPPLPEKATEVYWPWYKQYKSVYLSRPAQAQKAVWVIIYPAVTSFDSDRVPARIVQLRDSDSILTTLASGKYIAQWLALDGQLMVTHPIAVHK